MIKIRYSRKLVLWVDILGFTEFIKQSEIDPAIIDVVYKVIQKPPKLEANKFNYLDLGDLSDVEVEISAFSDTIVLSCEPTVKGLLYVFMYYLRFVSGLEGLGFFSRGSLVIEDIFHDAGCFFGPAVLKAVNLEKKANYPRVIIDDSVLELVNNENADIKEVINRFIRKDKDCSFIHSLFHYRLVSANKTNAHHVRSCLEFFRIVNLNLSSAIQMKNREEGDKIVSKYLWLNQYFESITGFMNKDIDKIIHGDISKYEEGITYYAVENGT